VNAGIWTYTSELRIVQSSHHNESVGFGERASPSAYEPEAAVSVADKHGFGRMNNILGRCSMENNEHEKERVSQNSPEEPGRESGTGQVEEREISIKEIKIGEFCRRRNYDGLDSLVKSIERNGLVQPVTVTADADGGYTLVCGSRRLKAYEQLGRKTIPCRIVNVPPAKAAVLSVVDNVDRKDMHPVELARKLRQIIKMFGYKEEEIADEMGWSQNTVSERVGILDLDEDILEKIGTDHESIFKYTHAVALSSLDRSKRFNCKIEVRQLFNKTIEHKLSTKELKAHVHLFEDGRYDGLPDRLRTDLLNEKNMTPQITMLYLEPAKIVGGEGKAADRQRQIAERLDKKWLENFIDKAVKAGWSFDRAKQVLLDQIKDRSESAEKKKSEPKSSWQKLVGDISTLQERLDICENEIPSQVKLNPGQLDSLCREIKQVQSKLDSFLGAATNALSESQLKQIA
jgi:ParB family chromosome partitioning protein